MSIPRKPQKVKLIYSIIGARDETVLQVADLLTKHFGSLSALSDSLPFNRTVYYEPEMGKNLLRRFVVFQELIVPNRLPGIKLWSNEVEALFAKEGCRAINLDPGYISPERLVLATGKNFTHRVYLDDGIYADLTLVFHKKSFRPLPWTYPDYADASVVDFLNHIRFDYLNQLRKSVSNS